MSRVGKQIIIIPEGITVSLTDGVFTAKGPKGELTKEFKNNIAITINGNEITLKPVDDSNFSYALWGTYASHIKNMIEGLVNPYKKQLALEGVGYRMALEGKTIVMSLGFSHEVRVSVPEGLDVVVEKNLITVSGIDKEKVGQFTASIRAMKKPEPYKGKGIRYVGEYIRRKQGKKSA
jgi:large subunit ribosomal protein L6